MSAQDVSVLSGKMLRIDPAAFPNVIPADNPFVGTPGARGEIWALGLRNPFTFAVDSVSGKIYVNDVGQDTWEEINLLEKGANYGWPTCEGNCANPSFKNPIYAYDHSVGCAITGGSFYSKNQFPTEYIGDYFFGDYCNGWVKHLEPNNTVTGFASGTGVFQTDLAVGNDGSLYYLSYSTGAVRQIRYIGVGNRSPIANATADVTTGAPPLTVNFSGASSSDPDGDVLTYIWDFGDGSALASGVSASHTYITDGQFNAILMVDDGKGGSASDTLIVRVGNPPIAAITLPVQGSTYNAGDTISFAGSASDAEDGTLAPSAFSWTILFHHEDHTHPFLGPISGVQNGAFQIPTTGELSDNVWYRIYLTVTDSTGLTHSVTRDIVPNKSTITYDTAPSGLQFTIDGLAFQTPKTMLDVVGMSRTINAISPQTLGGKSYEFASWSDGGAKQHAIQIPPTNASFIATYQEIADPTLVAHYAFDPPFANNDSSTNGLNGTAYGLPSVQGHAGSAYDWNDTGDRFTVIHPTVFDTLQSYTVSFWMNVDSAGSAGAGRVLHLLNGPLGEGKGLEILFDGTPNSIKVSESHWDSTGRWKYTRPTSFAGQWNHIAITYDGSSTFNDPKFYVNGALVSSVELTTPSGNWSGHNERLVIGNRYDDPSSERSLDGRLDEFRIYSRVLSENEIAALAEIVIANQSPTVNAGADQTIALPAQAALDGTVTDDNLPNPPGAVTVTWTKAAGPGTVTFANPNAPDTNASFSSDGVYTLRLTGNDGEFTMSDDIVITVNPADTQSPTVPGNLTGTPVKSNRVDLAWTASTDNAAVQGYRVFRDNFFIATTSATNFSDQSLTPSTAYSYEASAFDSSNNESARTAPVSVATGNAPAVASLTISPDTATVSVGQTKQFTAQGIDQYGDPIAVNPLWSVDGGGTIDANGLFTATTSGGPFTVVAQQGTVSDTSSVTVTQVPTEGLLAYWAFDEGGGTSALDSSGNGLHGSIFGLPSTLGYSNSAYEWNDAGDRISVIHPTAFDALRSYTVSFWMNPDSAGSANAGRVLHLLNGATGEGKSIEILFVGDPNTIRLSEGRWDSKGRWTYTHPTSFVGQWTHIAVVYDGNFLANDPIFYINGAQAGIVETTAPGGNWSGNPDRLVIGNRYDVSSSERQFDGKLDEFRVYSRVLTASEIAILAEGNQTPAVSVGQDQTASVLSGTNVNQEMLVGHWKLDTNWKLDQSNGLTAFESSGNNLHGRLVGGPLWIDGKVNSALSLDGVDDYVDATKTAFWSKIFDNTNDFTIAAWIKPDTFRHSSIVGQRYGEGMVFGLGVNGKLFLNMDDTRKGSPESRGVVQTLVWQHVAVVFRQVDHIATFYINGIPAGVGVAYDGNGIAIDDILFLGFQSRLDDGFPGYFKGGIDDVRIYSRALNGEEVAALVPGSASRDQTTQVTNYFDGRKAAIALILDTELYISKIHSRGGYSPLAAEAEANADRAAIDMILQDSADFGVPITFAMADHYPMFEDSGEHSAINKIHDWASMANGWADDHWRSNFWYADELAGGGNYVSHPLIYGGDLTEKVLKSPVSHEIGSHTFGHIQMDLADEAIIAGELQEAQSLWKSMGIKTTSLAPPWNANPQSSKYDEIKNAGIFVYNEVGAFTAPFELTEDLWTVRRSANNFAYNSLSDEIDVAIAKGLAIGEYSHPGDIGGQRALFQDNLAYIKSKVDVGELWAVTMSDIARYWEAKSNAVLSTHPAGDAKTLGVDINLFNYDVSSFGIPYLTLQTKVSNPEGLYRITVDFPSLVALNTSSPGVGEENGLLTYTIYLNPSGTTHVRIEEVKQSFSTGVDMNMPILNVQSVSHTAENGILMITAAIDSSNSLYNTSVIYWGNDAVKHAKNMELDPVLDDWKVEIGPFADGELVTYYVIAVDEGGRRIFSPERQFDGKEIAALAENVSSNETMTPPMGSMYNERL